MPYEDERLSLRFLPRQNFVDESYLLVFWRPAEQILLARHETCGYCQGGPIVLKQACGAE